MAALKPGPICQWQDSFAVEDGGMSRCPTPSPVPSGTVVDRSIESILTAIELQKSSLNSTIVTGANWPPPDTFSRIVLEISIEPAWGAIKKLLHRLLGSYCFSLGMAVGIGEDLVSSVVELAKLLKMFALADLYDVLHSRMPPLMRGHGVIGVLIAKAADQLIPDALKEAHEQREALVGEIKKIFDDPLKFFTSIKDEYIKKFEKFKELATKDDLVSQYEAGKIFGPLLLEVVGLFLSGAALVKGAAKLAPRLSKLAAKFKGKLPARGGGVGAIDDAADAKRLGAKAATPKKVPKDPRVRRSLDEKWLDDAGEVKWPPNKGVVGAETPGTLKPGQTIDRFGSEKGTFASPADAPFETRSLPYDPAAMPYQKYEVLKPIPCNTGEIAPWFDQPGGSLQYRFDTSIDDLIANGYLKRIN